MSAVTNSPGSKTSLHTISSPKLQSFYDTSKRVSTIFNNLSEIQNPPTQNQAQFQEWFYHFIYVLSKHVEQRTDLSDANEHDGNYEVTGKALSIFERTFASQGIEHSFITLQEIYGCSYFHRFLSRDDAKKRLNGEQGAALLRISTTIDQVWGDGLRGPFVISAHRRDQPMGSVSGIIVTPDEKGGWIHHGNPPFNSISDIFTNNQYMFDLKKLVPRPSPIPGDSYRSDFEAVVVKRRQD